jgi:UDP:flavonoid glycosyltransferase YjiC (YdhE family)
LTTRRGIFLAVQNGHVPEALPASVLRVAYAPFSLLLPACAGLVHHGGIGTTAQALSAGIPQRSMAATFDQFTTARVERLGAGVALEPEDFALEMATQVSERLLPTPEIGRACATARARLAGSDGTGTADTVLATITR